MAVMKNCRVLAALAAAVLSPDAFGQTSPAPAPSATAEVVVSAGKVPEDALDIPGQAEVVRGEDLRRRGARTLQDALQDVVGEIGRASCRERV